MSIQLPWNLSVQYLLIKILLMTFTANPPVSLPHSVTLCCRLKCLEDNLGIHPSSKVPHIGFQPLWIQHVKFRQIPLYASVTILDSVRTSLMRKNHVAFDQGTTEHTAWSSRKCWHNNAACHRKKTQITVSTKKYDHYSKGKSIGENDGVVRVNGSVFICEACFLQSQTCSNKSIAHVICQYVM